MYEDDFDECEGCGYRFYVKWRFPGGPNHQTFCTRCHALWMEYLHQPAAVALTSRQFTPFLRGEKELLKGMDFTPRPIDEVRAGVQKSVMNGGMEAGLGGP